MALRSTLSVAVLALSCAQAFAADATTVKREEVGTSVTPGNELKGDAHAATITYNGQSCKA